MIIIAYNNKFIYIFLIFNHFRYTIITGEVAERPKAAVLKTVEGKPSQGSNPCLSAITIIKELVSGESLDKSVSS